MNIFLAMAGFVIAVRGGKRRLIAGGGRQLVRHAFSFLRVQERKRLAKERRRQRKPFGRVFSGLFPKQRGRGPSDTLGLLGRYSTQIFEPRVGGDAHIAPCRRQNRNAKICGEFDGSQWAAVGIGPYAVAQAI